MPFARPTLITLRRQAMQDITASDLPGADGLLRRSALRVLAWVQAGLAHLHYGYLDWISRQSVPFTAADEFLEAWAGLKGVTRKSATGVAGTATFSGINGSIILNGTAVLRGDGQQYVATADAAASGGTTVVNIASVGQGTIYNFDDGTVFTLGLSVPGVVPQSIASAQTLSAADDETDDSLRTRMLQVYAAPPQGGDRNDYIEWALAIPSVTRAWIAPYAMGPGTVSVFFMMDQAEAAYGGFPQGTNGVAAADTRAATATGDQLTVANAIYASQPVTALVYAVAPTPAPVNFTIVDLSANNTAVIQAAITAALADMFLRLGNVGGTIDPASGAAWLAIEPSDWYTALAAIPGLTEFRVTVPNAAITPGAGQLFTVGTLTFAS